MRVAHISISGADKFPIPPKPLTLIPDKCVHTPCPDGYVARAEWAMKALRTHEQVPCRKCGLFAVWLPKREARAVNKRDLEEGKRIADSMELAHAQRVIRAAQRDSKKRAKKKN